MYACLWDLKNNSMQIKESKGVINFYILAQCPQNKDHPPIFLVPHKVIYIKWKIIKDEPDVETLRNLVIN